MAIFQSSEVGAVSRYTAVVKQNGDWWLGWVEEVPGVNAQEPTREALLPRPARRRLPVDASLPRSGTPSNTAAAKVFA